MVVVCVCISKAVQTDTAGESASLGAKLANKREQLRQARARNLR